MYSFAKPSEPDLQAMRLLGGGELGLSLIKDLVKVGFLLILTNSLLLLTCAIVAGGREVCETSVYCAEFEAER